MGVMAPGMFRTGGVPQVSHGQGADGAVAWASGNRWLQAVGVVRAEKAVRHRRRFHSRGERRGVDLRGGRRRDGQAQFTRVAAAARRGSDVRLLVGWRFVGTDVHATVVWHGRRWRLVTRLQGGLNAFNTGRYLRCSHLHPHRCSRPAARGYQANQEDDEQQTHLGMISQPAKTSELFACWAGCRAGHCLTARGESALRRTGYGGS